MGQAACHTISSNQARLLEQEVTMAEVKKQYGTVMHGLHKIHHQVTVAEVKSQRSSDQSV